MEQAVEKAASKVGSKAILLVTDFVFQPASNGTRKRVTSLVTILQSWGYAVHVITLDLGCSQEEVEDTRYLVDELTLFPWQADLDPYGLPSAKTLVGRVVKKTVREIRTLLGQWPPALDPDLEQRCPFHFREAVKKYAQQLNPVAVIVEYIWLSRCLLDLPQGILRAIDTIDLMHLRLQQYRGAGIHSFFQCTLEDELKCLRRADQVLVIQPEERKILSAYLPDEALLLVPHGHEILPPPKRERGKQLLFLGSSHAANVEGLKWFLAEVWPLLKKADSGIQLRVVGGAGLAIENDPKSIIASHDCDISGFIEDATMALHQADILINPILRGSGLKIKVVEALCCGLPVVSTSKGVEGVCAAGECEAVAIADNAADFCQRILDLLTNESDLKAVALQFSARRFSVSAAYGPLESVLNRARP